MQQGVNTTRRWLSRFRKLGKKEPKIQFNRRAPHVDAWKWLKKTFWHLAAKTPFYNPDKNRTRSITPGDWQRKKVARVRSKFPRNSISTTKYGPITFLPKNLFEQFKRVANVWFLIVVILQVIHQRFCKNLTLITLSLHVQLIPGISPLNPASSIVPLVFVLSVTAVKEAAEDIVSLKQLFSHCFLVI